RRRANIVEKIRDTLRKANLVTIPDFTSTWIDAEIAFAQAPKEATANTETPAAPKITEGATSSEDEPKDAIHLIRMLSPANRGVLSVKPQDRLKLAVTLMLAHDFSQLPVMTGPRDLKGVVSWKSIGGRL